ncbi:MAG: hypothetical protein ACYC5V_03715 [Gemmatimonadaceae bacterium]
MFDTIQMLGLSICLRDAIATEYFCQYLSIDYLGSAADLCCLNAFFAALLGRSAG